jgi:hypothetical protein
MINVSPIWYAVTPDLPLRFSYGRILYALRYVWKGIAGFEFAMPVCKNNRLICGIMVIKNSHERIHESREHCVGLLLVSLKMFEKQPVRKRKKLWNVV